MQLPKILPATEKVYSELIDFCNSKMKVMEKEKTPFVGAQVFIALLLVLLAFEDELDDPKTKRIVENCSV